jgi:acetyl-CoA carboxylase carboxyl transferase subunit beta
MAWFNKKAEPKVTTGEEKKNRMEGLWTKCDKCEEILYRQELERNLNVCQFCGHHMKWNARARLTDLLDDGFLEEADIHLHSDDPLTFSDSKKYKDRIKAARKSLGEDDAFISGMGRIDKHPVSIGIFNFDFMAGSMGSAVGEKITRLFERATERKCAAIIFSTSGGARMQEGILSLMQMAKTSTALAAYRAVGKPYISVLLDPTTGGVAASFSFLGDVIIAEPCALIGFAGARVIEQTMRQKLPPGFQRSEFLLERGMIDGIVHRKDMKEYLAKMLGLLC